jgi:hypothetical protein
MLREQTMTSSAMTGQQRFPASACSPRVRSSRCCHGSSGSRASRLTALLLVGLALLATGALVGVLSGGPPLKRGLRQLAIGFGAAAVTYALGLLFGVGAA